MYFEIVPELYDIHGHRTTPWHLRRKTLKSTFPLGRYVREPLSVQCESLEDVARFLRGCKKMEDIDAFGRDEYWSPPEEFERHRRGDCDDFAMWTWRQLLQMGYSARFVGGQAGQFGEGHAWVTFEREGRHFVFESMLAGLPAPLPRLTTMRYHPRVSLEWDGDHFRYFTHKEPAGHLSLAASASLFAEWASYWTKFWIRVLLRLPLLPFRLVRRRLAKRA